MVSFQCTQCKVCQRRKTIWEAFNHSSTCCDDCFTPPEEKVKKKDKLLDDEKKHEWDTTGKIQRQRKYTNSL